MPNKYKYSLRVDKGGGIVDDDNDDNKDDDHDDNNSTTNKEGSDRASNNMLQYTSKAKHILIDKQASNSKISI